MFGEIDFKSISYLGPCALTVASDPGSLTRNLQRMVRHSLVFSCLNHAVLTLNPSHASYLGREAKEKSVRRAILWSYQNHDWVYAETTMPMESYQWLFERHSEARPIGELLFGEDANDVVISPLAFAMIDDTSDLYARVLAHITQPLDQSSLLVRRRKFMVNEDYPLMIEEVFLPGMQYYFNQLKKK